MECLGCGFQRSCIALLRGQIEQSFYLYPATIPFLCTLLFTAIHLKFKIKNGSKIITTSFIITVSIMLVAYIIKIFHHKIFLN